MTNIISSAAGIARHRSLRYRGAALAAILVSGIGLAGCETGSAVLGTTGSTQPETLIAQPPAVAKTRISIAPVIGAPDSVSKQLAQDFSAAIGQKSVVVVGPQDKADYALRGYIVAAKDKTGTKVSYIWDVTDPGNRRVNRVTGEEVIAGTTGSDAWAAVTPQITQAIAQKSAGSLASWLQQQTPPQPTLVSAAPTIGATSQQAAVSQTSVGAIPPMSAPTTGSTPRMAAAAPTATSGGPVAAVIPSLTGAPGDGNNALASALQAELTKNGVGSASQGGTPYRVEGVVKVGAVADGKQPVQIDWNVKDPQGKRLGTVTQKNEIVAGSLDNSWGRTADAAAAAAAQGILKLLPKGTASN